MTNHPTAKVALVTGASSGIGKAAVEALLGRGFVVHATARRVQAMRDLEKKGAAVHHADLRSPEDIARVVNTVLGQGGRIDVLVNNAGYGSYGAIEEVPISVAREQLEVNLFAAAQLIQQVLPAMRSQRHGTIINVTSIGGKMAGPLGGWYHTSKFALEGLSDSLRREMHPFGIDVVVVEPGGVKTEWGSIAVDSLMSVSGKGPYKALANAMGNLMAGGAVDKTSAEPRDIGNLIARIAETKKPKARYVAPLQGKVLLFLEWVLSDAAFDYLLRKVFRMPNAV